MRRTSAPHIALQTGPLDAARLREFGTEALLAVLIRADGDAVAPVGSTGDHGIDLGALAVRAGAGASAGSATTVTLPALVSGSAPWAGMPDRLVLAGVGDEGTTAMRRAGAALARAAVQAEHLLVDLSGLDEPTAPALRALIEGLLLGSYRAPFTGAGPGPEAPCPLITLTGPVSADDLDRARTSAEATVLARTLAATPSNIKTPAWVAEQAREAAEGVAGVKVTEHDEKWLAAQGLEGILAVGAAAAGPPRLVTVTYTPPRRARAEGGAQDPIVLVGKGITYDTGGLSIKPREAMVPMKTDMSGAAVVLAVVLGAARAQVPVPVVAVLPLAENAVGARSYRPGDVLTMVDGTTVEIANTDAEGRLVLADAMAWARSEYHPRALVDVATLTGAATLGLGKKHAALFSTDADLTSALTAAGEVTGEALWAMPLVPEYRSALDSPVADLCHVNTDPHTSAGAITAALFLQHFAGDTPWAHLDIAGPGRSPKNEHEIAEGPTGYSARALLHWLIERD
ncbi:M17 family peptidase N-terminal domain-containing protein [Pseudactinotalea sp. Z1739]|uniref:leucyl aminopeptidase family protein n=1 Tax=Pseudactinotalea sp. Z1739 TaxID=3413028 RepID=UPI003C7E7177